jgi:hypothetical protein
MVSPQLGSWVGCPRFSGAWRLYPPLDPRLPFGFAHRRPYMASPRLEGASCMRLGCSLAHRRQTRAHPGWRRRRRALQAGGHPFDPSRSASMNLHHIIATVVASTFVLTASGCAVQRGQQSPGAYVDDASITAALKTRYVGKTTGGRLGHQRRDDERRRPAVGLREGRHREIRRRKHGLEDRRREVGEERDHRPPVRPTRRPLTRSTRGATS